VLFIFQFRICLTYPDLRIRDSSFLKVAHRTRWRAVGGGTWRRPRVFKARWHPKSETAK